MTAPLTPERLRLIRVVHEKFCEWCEQQMDCPVADLLAEVDRAEVDRLRAQVAAVQAVRDDLRGDSEGDCDFNNDPVGCILDALDAALASGDEVQP